MKPTCEVYRQRNGLWSWRLKAGNSQVVATPRRAFPGPAASQEKAGLIKWAFADSPEGMLVHYSGSGRAWRWKASWGRDHCYPHESFTSLWGAKRSVRTVRRVFKKARVKVIE